MNAQTTAHRFANNSYTSRGTLGAGTNLFADESTKTIYSYGYHFPIARKTGNLDFPVLFTNRAYSSSTARHILLVSRALSHFDKFYCSNPSDSPTSILREEWQEARTQFSGIATALAEVKTLEARIAAREAKRQPASATLAERLETAQGKHARLSLDLTNRIAELERFAKSFALNVKKDCGVATEAIRKTLKSGNFAKASDAIRRDAEKAEKARLKAQAEREAKWKLENAEREAEWLAGGGAGYFDSTLGFTRLRVKNGNVETSRGAEVPIPHALRLFALATKCREAGAEWSSPPEKSFAVGHYTLSSIDKRGNVTIGCHSLEFVEMERIAPECI